MSLPRRFSSRVARLEHVVWVADVRVSCVRLMAASAPTVGVAPAVVKDLCTALDQTLDTLSQAMPACITDLSAAEAFTAHILAAVLALLDTQVTDPSTRDRLRETFSQACRREAMARGRARMA